MKFEKFFFYIFAAFALLCVLPIIAQTADDTARVGETSVRAEESISPLAAPVRLAYTFSGTYTLVERSDWSQYVNGKYVGLTSRETRGYMNPEKRTESGTKYSGRFYVTERTLRNAVQSARALDEIQDAAFTVRPDGSVLFEKDNRYPQLRNFPVFPSAAVKPGDRWQSEGERIVDPKNDKHFTCLPIVVEYEFIGQEIYNGKSVYRIKARFATRLNAYNRPRTADAELRTASGSHDVSVLADAETCAVILMIDKLDETFSYADGGTVRFRGTTSWFTEMPVRVESGELYRRTSLIAEKAVQKADGQISVPVASRDDTFGGSGDVPAGKQTQTGGDVPAGKQTQTGGGGVNTASLFEIEDTQQGLRLSVRDIRFRPDSAEILSEESWRLDAIADMLRSEPDAVYLVEGHTASVGKPEGEKKLSVERAQAVVAALVSRGFRKEQFLFTGYGGTRPVADNGTAAGRAENRRVEITILR